MLIQFAVCVTRISICGTAEQAKVCLISGAHDESGLDRCSDRVEAAHVPSNYLLLSGRRSEHALQRFAKGSARGSTRAKRMHSALKMLGLTDHNMRHCKHQGFSDPLPGDQAGAELSGNDGCHPQTSTWGLVTHNG